MTQRATAALLLLFCTATAFAADARRSTNAVRATKAPVIDGDLSDEVWQGAPEITGFIQHDPDDGKPSTQNTVVKVAYDDEAIYFAARLEDTKPVTTLLSRRDNNLESDWFRIYIDSRYDRLSGAAFWINPSNVQVDMILYNDIYNDWSWDAVWSSAAKIVPGGWVAEARIPYSQLRFPERDVQTWGINFARRIASNKEVAWLVNTPKNETGIVSRFADLHGISGIKPERSLEIVPYGVARSDLYSRVDPLDPFASPSTHRMDGGVDLKYGLTSNLTLTGTINPDFGQVEVDPAVVNLSQFETFFPEKRPFFTEGAQMFSFGSGPANSRWGFNIGMPTYFYSRRIGRSPQGTGSVDADYIDAPGETTILGAAKITGKFGKGWSIGVLDALTDRETADFELDSLRRDQQVEPMTNYLVARTAKEIGDNKRIGIFFSSVNRRLPDELSYLRENAYSFGVDGYRLSKKKDWILEWVAIGSTVTGSPEAIEATQKSPARYYQRSDAGHVELDPTRTSLSGWGGRVMLGKGTGKWRTNVQAQMYTPGFEINDVGFMGRTDFLTTHAVLHYVNQDVTKYTRYISAWVAKYQNWNLDGDLIADGAFADWYMDFKNYWYTFGWTGAGFKAYDDRKSRGDVLIERSPNVDAGLGIGSDSRKKLSFETWVGAFRAKDGGYLNSASLSLNYRPSPSVRLSLSPSFRREFINAQFVTPLQDGRRIYGELDQRTLDIGTRVEWTASSRLSFQLYLQPFIASGDYHDFKELAAPRTRDYVPSTYDDNHDFNLRSVRGSAVVRWEFRPGSALYVVWNENRSEVVDTGDFRFRRDFSAIPAARSEDVFLVKLSYWLPI